jgi:hypothetical protein
MKRFKNYIPVILTIVFLFSCEEKLEDLNIDPNNPSAVTPELALPAGITSVASVVGGRFAIVGGIWSQYYTQNNASNQYKDIDAFYFTPSDFSTEWQEYYAGGLNDLKYVKEAAAANQDWNFYLIASLVEVYGFHFLTDIYGDIPFSEALRGDEGLSEPVFESSRSIYDSLLARIDNAMAKDFTAPTATDPGDADFIFGGDIDKWIQFGNTLKLKILLRFAEVEPNVAAAGIQQLYASGAQFLSEDAALDHFTDEAGKRNPFFEQDKSPALNTNQNLKASRTLFDLLNQYGDPRQDDIYNEAEDAAGGYKAMNQGDFNATSTALPPLTISTAKVGPTDPVFLISEAETYFLQAEAVERGWGTGDAEQLYNMGVTAAFERFGEDAAPLLAGPYALNTFASAPHLNGSGDRLGAILTQKWMALAGTYQGIEAFFDRMRTGYPLVSTVYHTDANYKAGQVVYPKEGTTSGKFATRVFLPDTETARNPNAPDQPAISDPMWWHSFVQ